MLGFTKFFIFLQAAMEEGAEVTEAAASEEEEGGEASAVEEEIEAVR